MPTRSLLPVLPTLPWPAPALLAWAGAWASWAMAVACGGPPLLALAAGAAAGLGLAGAAAVGRRRRFIAAAGFPLSALALGAAALPAWSWLALLVPLALAYPLRAWRDAPFFPTPPQALDGLAAAVGAPRRALDAGCGLGHGLAEMHRLWPQAELHGLEWSRPLAWAAAWRCGFARVRRGDMWAASWSGYDLVYLFQRPESMARAHAKAARELAPGAWLVSLEFAVPDRTPCACVQAPGRRPVWIYRPSAPPAPSTSGVRSR